MTPAASIEGQARLVPDLSAARSATGAGHFVIRGLDRFTNEIVNADIANKETILAVIATLGVLGAETIENGVTTHSYGIELRADGGFIVNGEDLSLFLGR